MTGIWQASAQQADEEASPPAPIFQYNRQGDRPSDIVPGPYILPGSLIDDPFRAAPPEQTEDDADTLRDDLVFFNILDRDEPASSGPGIEADELGGIHPSAIGALNMSAGVLPFDMWQGTDHELALAIMRRMPVANRSPAMNKLGTRLLLSPAREPMGAAADDLRLLDARLERLLASGRSDHVKTLLAVLPAHVETQQVRDARLTLALLEGDVLTACAIARDAVSQSGAADWIRVLTFCAAANGDRGGAEFNLNLLRETGDTNSDFEALIYDIVDLGEGADPLSVGGVADIEGMEADALTFAMLHAGRREVPLDQLDLLPPLFLDALSRRPDLPPDYRIEVARLSALRGLMDGADMASLFAALDITEGERGAADILAETSESARTDGVILSAAREAATPKDIVESLQHGWQRAQRHGTTVAMAGALAEILEPLQPTADLLFFAHDAVRMSLAAGRSDLAGRWAGLVRYRAARGDREAQGVLVKMWPLLLLSGVGEGAGEGMIYSENILGLWQREMSADAEANLVMASGQFYPLLDVMGYDLDDQHWNRLLLASAPRQGQLPPFAAWRQFLSAASAGRYGESLALSLMMLGEDGPAKADPAVLASVISVLGAMGLEASGRALAVEAMIQNGF